MNRSWPVSGWSLLCSTVLPGLVAASHQRARQRTEMLWDGPARWARAAGAVTGVRTGARAAALARGGTHTLRLASDGLWAYPEMAGRRPHTPTRPWQLLGSSAQESTPQMTRCVHTFTPRPSWAARPAAAQVRQADARPGAALAFPQRPRRVCSSVSAWWSGAGPGSALCLPQAHPCPA